MKLFKVRARESQSPCGRHSPTQERSTKIDCNPRSSKLSQSHTGKRPVAKCKRCRQRRKTVLLGEMICEVCHRKEPKATCCVCGKEKRFVKDGAGLCPLCIRRALLLTEIECARCGRSKPVAKPYGAYCQDCQRIVNCGEGRCSRCGKDKPYVH